ncbi:MAG: DUF4870 domain-containing protein [Planctomycetaceae bacterium]|jgi:uncharacterized Tic20 family protein|nr:DUF4870 domain-containing protein [Planctomycetaceae bacterium]
MANWYYYDNNGQKQGPITSAQLQTLVANKIVIPATKIVTEDGRETVAGSINGLFLTPPPVAVSASDTSTETVTPQTVIFCSGMDSNILFMFMHLCGLLFFPMMIFLWVVAKDSDRANIHGKIILNWYFSAAVYMIGWLLVKIIVTFLSFIIYEVTRSYQIIQIVRAIPALCLLVFMILLIIFPIIAAVKAANGKIWKYPFSLPFLFRVNVPKN